ncbi:hypothetical protein VTL71DRAFT_1744 [Oculimacula yallundae]|uniref:PHD-type domain-containing protein n=1 Tax=Oculimacula yallundae TaxID=86028 RepID=A0ABR4CBM2_9HELO
MSSIALRARKCLAHLERLVGLLKQPDPEHIGLTELEAVDVLDRFRIWAANIGALQDVNMKSSLEHRVRDAPKIAKQITELLDELAESLEDVHLIASHARENRTGALHESKTSLSTENLDLGKDAELNGSEDEELSEIREIYASIEDAIGNLFRFSIIIRNNTNRDRYAKASAAAITNPFNDQFDICHVEQKFPALGKSNDRWLIDRLGKAVTQRRQYLKYSRDHRDKIASEPQILGSEIGLVRPPVASPQMPSTVLPIARSDYSKPTSTLAPTQASTLMLTSGDVIETEIEENLSQTSYATSTDEESSNATITVIKLEEVSKGSKHFECPYCWQIQTARSQKAWKKHVLSDLKPYVCTFENCELKMFSDKHTWFTHELKDHRQEWRCYFCSHRPFKDSDDYQNHLTSSHSESFVINQFPALLEMSKKALSGLSPSDCPLCDEWEVRLRSINPHIPANEILAVTTSQFQHHVGAHMEQLALFAIPRGYTEDGEADSGNAAPQKGSDISTLHDSDADSYIAKELRFCEEIMVDLVQEVNPRYLSKFTTIPPFHLWIPGKGRMMISPLSINEIVQKLENGEYEEAADLFLDMNLFFAIFDVTDATGTHGKIRLVFDTLWDRKIGSPTGYPYGYNLRTTLEREIGWLLWSVAETSKHSAPCFKGAQPSPATILVRMEMQNGEIFRREFLESANVEHLYMLAECYELIDVLPSVLSSTMAMNHQHEYHFRLNPASDITSSRGYFLDLGASLRSVVQSSVVGVVVLGLRDGGPGRLSKHWHGPLVEDTEEIGYKSHPQNSNSGDGEASWARIVKVGDYQLAAEPNPKTQQQFDRQSEDESLSESSGDEAPWEKANSIFVSSLDSTERHQFDTADAENTMSDVAYPCGSDDDDDEQPGLPRLRVLKGLIKTVVSYGNVVTETASTRGGRVPTVLGCLKVVLMLSAPREDLFKSLVGVLESIGRILPQPHPADYEIDTEQLDHYHPRKFEVLEAMFLELISFCTDYLQLFYSLEPADELSGSRELFSEAPARFQACLDKFESRTKVDEGDTGDVSTERSGVEATDGSVREGYEWQEEWGELPNAPESDPSLCMYCHQTQENDPSGSQDHYLQCESCHKNAHADCAIGAGTLDFQDETRPEPWTCPDCLKTALKVALSPKSPAEAIHDFRPPSQEGDDSTWKFDPWNAQSRRYRKEVEGNITYQYGPPKPDPTDFVSLGTLAIVIVQATDVLKNLPLSSGKEMVFVTVNVGGVKGRAEISGGTRGSSKWHTDINLPLADFEGLGRVAISVMGKGNTFLGKTFINLIGPLIRDKGRVGRRWYGLEREGENVGAIELEVRFYPNPQATAGGKGRKDDVTEGRKDTDLCVLCNQKDENSPRQSFQPYVVCRFCSKNAHRQCAWGIGALDPLENDVWTCPDCVQDSLRASSSEAPAEKPVQSRSLRSTISSAFKSAPWSSKSKRSPRNNRALQQFRKAKSLDASSTTPV